MTRRMTIIALISISLMCCFDTYNAAATGYFYEHPISPFNSPSFSTLPSTGPFSDIPIGLKTGVPDALFGDFYVINGRQLKQYMVHEQIDNDIDQQVENFIPANFFINSYHAKIGPTQPLGEDVTLQTRFSDQIAQPRQGTTLQPQQQRADNTFSLGSGGLGFVQLPNGNVYLGSGSLGYTSALQHRQDVLDARTRTGSTTPDAVHFGHGSLSDRYYYN